MSPTTDPGTARSTIAEVLEEFLADQESRLAPRTDRDLIELLQSSLDGYAADLLPKLLVVGSDSEIH